MIASHQSNTCLRRRRAQQCECGRNSGGRRSTSAADTADRQSGTCAAHTALPAAAGAIETKGGGKRRAIRGGFARGRELCVALFGRQQTARDEIIRYEGVNKWR